MSDEERQKRYRKRLLALVAAQIGAALVAEVPLHLCCEMLAEDQLATLAVRIADKILRAAEAI